MAIHKITALEPDKIIAFLQENHEELEDKFHQFFPDLVEYVKTEKQTEKLYTST
jgi:hypothetical protein